MITRGTLPAFAGGNTGRNNGLYAVGAAVAPTKIGLTTPRPSDFDAFWYGKLADQAKVPINAILIPVETIRVPVMSMLPMSMSAASRRT